MWTDPWAAQFRARAPFAVVVPTAYGQMILHRFDDAQGTPGFRGGLAMAHREIRLLARVLQSIGDESVFVDVGANVGNFSIALAHAIGPRGKIYAFEPQRIIFNMLAGSVALNSLMNVFCFNIAIGDHEGRVEIPQFDYFRPMSFGSIEFGSEQRERLAQERGHDASQVEFVPITTLDHFDFARLDLLKLDAEGMEIEIFRGAAATIRRCRPIIFVEFLKVDKKALENLLASLDYALGDAGGYNFLAIPREKASQLPSIADFLSGLD
jgi:FkbM family methyltransferase